MGIAFVSLHVGKPESQLDQEVSYTGYVRMPIEWDGKLFEKPMTVTFPVVEEDTTEVVTYCAIGAAEKGQGEIFMRIPILPNIPILAALERRTTEFWMARHGMTEEQAKEAVESHGMVAPRVVLCNSDPVDLPMHLNPIARIAHQLVYSGLIEPADLHPKLFEAINDALHNAGVPVLKVKRDGAATMNAKLSELPSLH